MKIEFQIKNKKWKIAGITIGDWYHIQDEMILNPHAAIAITSYLSGCPEEDLKQLGVEEWSLLWESVEDFITEAKAPTGQISKVITLDSQKYYLIDQDAMSIGEFADLDIIVSSPGAEKRLHELAAILYRPKIDGAIEEYNSESFKIRAEAFKMLPLNDTTKVLNFFFHFAHQYLSNTVDYLKSTIKEETIPENKEILQTTLRLLQEAGTRLSSYLPTNEYSSLTQSQSSDLKCASIGLRISRTKSESKNSKLRRVLQNTNVN